MGVRVQTLTNPRDTPVGVGFGTILSIQVAAPAAGADFSQTVPGNRIWNLRSCRISLTTAVAVANRYVILQITDGTNIKVRWYPAITQPAGQTTEYDFQQGSLSQTGGAPFILSYIPTPFFIRSGWVIQTATVNIQAADQFSAAELIVDSYAAVMP